MDLKDIKDPSFLKSLNKKELNELAADIRSFLLEKVSKTGGHLASNLGVIELTIALHYCFNEISDSIIFDIGHQAYAHKILTGRASEFDTLRKMNGLSGFISYSESPYDKWESGHAGTAISALTAFLIKNRLKNNDNHVVAVVGDSSIVSGTSFEALNLLSNYKEKGIIILNDNKMSISKPVGGFSSLLIRSRGTRALKRTKKILRIIFPKPFHSFFGRMKRSVKGFFQIQNIFEDLGYEYMGPYDGHDIKGLIFALERAKKSSKSVVLHVLTEKGKGYLPAEENPTLFHGTSGFDLETGETKSGNCPSFSKVIARIVYNIKKKEDIFVVMPAMTVGAHFEDFLADFPDYYLDVGIAEEHAASLAGALAHENIKVFLPLYSTFAQRAYDQILNDISRPNVHVVIGIDRAGLVPEDGNTHQGLYDISMFKNMPNMMITMPHTPKEAESLLHYGFFKHNGPFVIRYEKCDADYDLSIETDPLEIEFSYDYLSRGNDINIISYGRELDIILDVIKENKISANIINARFIYPLDEKTLHDLFSDGKKILIVEEASFAPLYLDILNFKNLNNYQNNVISVSVTKPTYSQGDYESLLKINNLDKDSILKKLKELL